jgi:hypothetical protein
MKSYFKKEKVYECFEWFVSYSLLDYHFYTDFVDIWFRLKANGGFDQ